MVGPSFTGRVVRFVSRNRASIGWRFACSVASFMRWQHRSRFSVKATFYCVRHPIQQPMRPRSHNNHAFRLGELHNCIFFVAKAANCNPEIHNSLLLICSAQLFIGHRPIKTIGQ